MYVFCVQVPFQPPFYFRPFFGKGTFKRDVYWVCRVCSLQQQVGKWRFISGSPKRVRILMVTGILWGCHTHTQDMAALTKIHKATNNHSTCMLIHFRGMLVLYVFWVPNIPLMYVFFVNTYQQRQRCQLPFLPWPLPQPPLWLFQEEKVDLSSMLRETLAFEPLTWQLAVGKFEIYQLLQSDLLIPQMEVTQKPWKGHLRVQTRSRLEEPGRWYQFSEKTTKTLFELSYNASMTMTIVGSI